MKEVLVAEGPLLGQIKRGPLVCVQTCCGMELHHEPRRLSHAAAEEEERGGGAGLGVAAAVCGKLGGGLLPKGEGSVTCG